MRKRKTSIAIAVASMLAVLLLSYGLTLTTSTVKAQEGELLKNPIPFLSHFSTLNTSTTAVQEGELAKLLEGPANTVYFEVRVDPKTKRISAVGVSADNLASALNILPLDQRVVDILKETGSLSISIHGSEILLKSVKDGVVLATINWDQERRESMMKLASDNGVRFSEESQELIERMLASSDVEIVLMVKPGLAKAATLNLTSLIPANFDEKGKLLVLGVETPIDIGPSLVKEFTDAGVKSFSACYNQGTLEPSANDSKLPSITIHEAGFDLFNNALGNTFGLTIGDKDAYKSQRVGVVVVMPDGELPEDTTCGVTD